MADQPCKWPDAHAYFWIDFSRVPPPLTSEDFSAAVAWAVEQWQSACDFVFTPVTNSVYARLVCSFGLLDESGVELGLTQEPCGVDPRAQLWSKYNTVAAWSPARLKLTVLHELGHFLGLQHAPDGTKSIMSAILDESLTGLTPYDIATIQALYGQHPSAVGTPATPSPQSQTYDPVEIPLPTGGKLRVEFTFVPGS
ncbi:MAG TPA: matrixin family metalloprotease [Gemmatimonadales bacterium]|nr:matrixin family metalloprotease [Gemmatimonadales bacterium]